jgi:hypothetical protein
MSHTHSIKTDNNLGEMLVPDIWHGSADQIPFDEYQWIKNIKGRVWCRLFEKMPSMPRDFYLPNGYDVYIISFHLEPIDLDWIDEVSKTLQAPLIVLGDMFDIDYPVPDHVFMMPYLYWQRQLDLGMQWFPQPKNLVKNIKYKASAVFAKVRKC